MYMLKLFEKIDFQLPWHINYIRGTIKSQRIMKQPIRTQQNC